MPYRFLDSEKHVKTLINKLDHLGYVFMERTEPYRWASLKFTRIWNDSDTLIIQWKREFVADGTMEQDSDLFIIQQDMELEAIDIAKLLQWKLESPLNDIILERIIKTVENAPNN